MSLYPGSELRHSWPVTAPGGPASAFTPHRRLGPLQAECLVELRYVPAGDGHGLVGARVGGDEQRSLEALLHLPDPADIDQEPAVYAEESLAFELLCQPVEATGG